MSIGMRPAITRPARRSCASPHRSAAAPCSIDSTATAQPHLDRLAERTGESTYLAVSDGRTATYVATAESSRAIRHVGWVGQNVDLSGTALGAALAGRVRSPLAPAPSKPTSPP